MNGEEDGMPTPPDKERCSRKAGKWWWCKKRKLDGQNMCEQHAKSSKKKRRFGKAQKGTDSSENSGLTAQNSPENVDFGSTNGVSSRNHGATGDNLMKNQNLEVEKGRDRGRLNGEDDDEVIQRVSTNIIASNGVRERSKSRRGRQTRNNQKEKGHFDVEEEIDTPEITRSTRYTLRAANVFKQVEQPVSDGQQRKDITVSCVIHLCVL